MRFGSRYIDNMGKRVAHPTRCPHLHAGDGSQQSHNSVAPADLVERFGAGPQISYFFKLS